jgi:hypothetical protein
MRPTAPLHPVMPRKSLTRLITWRRSGKRGTRMMRSNWPKPRAMPPKRFHREPEIRHSIYRSFGEHAVHGMRRTERLGSGLHDQIGLWLSNRSPRALLNHQLGRLRRFGFGCRTYPDEGKRAGVPPAAWIRAAGSRRAAKRELKLALDPSLRRGSARLSGCVQVPPVCQSSATWRGLKAACFETRSAGGKSLKSARRAAHSSSVPLLGAHLFSHCPDCEDFWR